MESTVNGRRDGRTAQCRIVRSYGGPLDRGILIDGRNGLPLLRFVNPGWDVDHCEKLISLRYTLLLGHIWVLAANVGRLDASTAGDCSMRRCEAGTFRPQTPEWPRFSIQTMEAQAERVMRRPARRTSVLRCPCCRRGCRTGPDAEQRKVQPQAICRWAKGSSGQVMESVWDQVRVGIVRSTTTAHPIEVAGGLVATLGP